MTDLASVRDPKPTTSRRVVFWHDPPAGTPPTSMTSISVRWASSASKTTSSTWKHPSSLTRFASTSSIAIRRHPTRNRELAADMEIAYGIFTADKASMLQQELGLSDPGLLPGDRAASGKFSLRKAADRHSRTPERRRRCDSPPCEDVPEVLVKAPGNKLTDIVRELLVENAARKTDKFDELLTYDLDQFFWDGLGSIYKYQRTTPTIDDFVLWMFERAIEDFASTIPDEFRNIRSDFNSLRYDVRTQNAMTTLASRAADALDVKSRIEHGDYRETGQGHDLRRDRPKVVVDLAAAVATLARWCPGGRRHLCDNAKEPMEGQITPSSTRQSKRVELLAAIGVSPPLTRLPGLDKYQVKLVPYRPTLSLVHIRSPNRRVPPAA